jgi:hypothetical protein
MAYKKGKHSEKMSEDGLKAILDMGLSNALGKHDGELSEQRRQSMHAYYGQSIGNEVAGRSRIVTRDVLEVIEWAMPELMDVFTSDEQVCLFTPKSEKDQAEAEQATDYVNHLFFHENNGFKVFYDMMKDALMQKTGTVKVWWDDTPETKKEEYTGLDDFQFQKLASDEDMEILAHTSYPLADEETAQALGVPDLMLHDIEVLRTYNDGCIKVQVVPPEEMLISKRARTIEDADLIAHRTQKTISDVKEMFPDADFDEIETMASGNDDDQEWDEEYIARHDFDGSHDGYDHHRTDKLGQKLWVTECYLNVDFDGDGVAELRKVTKIGHTILENEEVDVRPFALITPIAIPHKLFGMSLADITMDLQVTKSAILRNILDNNYNLTHGRFEAVDGQVNMDDLLTSRPGGVVRVKTPGALKRLDTPPMPAGGYDMLSYLDQQRDGRTGISKFRTGLDTDFLNNAKAGPVDNQMEAANARLRLYARSFKETGFKRMFELMYKNVVMHQQRKQMIRQRGEWAQIDPSSWGGDCNVTVKTGMGHGDRAKKLQESTMIAQNYAMLRQDPEMRAMITRGNIYNSFAEGLKAMDRKNVGDYITDPKKLPPYKPQPDPKAQAEQAKAQADMKRIELEGQKLQMEGQKMKAQMGLEQQKSQLEVQKIKIDMAKEQQKAEIEMAKLRASLTAEEQQNMIEHEKSGIEVMKLQAEIYKVEAEIAQKDAELALAYEELAVEKDQNRSIKIGN